MPNVDNVLKLQGTDLYEELFKMGESSFTKKEIEKLSLTLIGSIPKGTKKVMFERLLNGIYQADYWKSLY